MNHATLLNAHAPEQEVCPGRSALDLLDDIDIICAHLSQWLEDQPRPANSSDRLVSAAGRSIALICEDRYLFAVGLLAAWRLDLCVVLPPNGQPANVDMAIAVAGAWGVMHDTQRDVGLRLPACLASPMQQVPSPPVATDPGPERATQRLLTLPMGKSAAVLFTSGTTGRYRPFAKTGDQLISEVSSLLRTLIDETPGCFVATVPPHHLYGLLFSVLLPLAANGSFSRSTPLHAESVAAAVRAHRATHVVTVPAHLRTWSVLAPGQLDGLRAVFSSTAPLAERVSASVRRDHGVEVTEVLGSTETGGIAWRRGATRWLPLADVALRLDDDARLLVASPFVSADLAEGTAMPDPPNPPGGTGWFQTNERAELGADGAFTYLGRTDDVVKVAGKRLALNHLQARVCALPEVADAIALARPVHGARGVEICVVVQPTLSDKPVQRLTLQSVRRQLGRWFEPSQLPRRLRVVQQLPRSATGKIARSQLLALFDTPGATRFKSSDTTSEREGSQTRIAGSPSRASDDSWIFHATVPATSQRFDGHFPGDPVFPGIAVLHDLVLPAVAQLRPELGPPTELRRLKFRAIVRPNTALTVRVRWIDGLWPTARFRVEARHVEADVPSDLGPESSPVCVYAQGALAWPGAAA